MERLAASAGGGMNAIRAALLNPTTHFVAALTVAYIVINLAEAYL